MKRKDGRELVTEHLVTAQDMIDVIPRGEFTIPADAIACGLREPADTSWMDPDGPEADFDEGKWGASACPHSAHRLPRHGVVM
ncbi:hypothetical protein [Microbacterium sp.]|uniref:hypothetical protein n=1 Tax=Microbacterium sp. TaxID=51671 RepID=UPI003A91A2B9